MKSYKETLKELIKLEEETESKEKTMFTETYLNQLKRRLKIYEKAEKELNSLKDGKVSQ